MVRSIIYQPMVRLIHISESYSYSRYMIYHTLLNLKLVTYDQVNQLNPTFQVVLWSESLKKKNNTRGVIASVKLCYHWNTLWYLVLWGSHVRLIWHCHSETSHTIIHNPQMHILSRVYLKHDGISDHELNLVECNICVLHDHIWVAPITISSSQISNINYNFFSFLLSISVRGGTLIFWVGTGRIWISGTWIWWAWTWLTGIWGAAAGWRVWTILSPFHLPPLLHHSCF